MSAEAKTIPTRYRRKTPLPVEAARFEGGIESYLRIVGWMRAAGNTQALANEVKYLTWAEAAREGFDSPREFEKAFAEINGTYDPEALVWRIEFELLAATS